MIKSSKKKKLKLLFNLPKAISLAIKLLKNNQVNFFSKAFFLFGTLLYWILPFDLIPDLPLIGQLDDLTITYLLLQWFINSAPQEIIEKIRRQSED